MRLSAFYAVCIFFALFSIGENIFFWMGTAGLNVLVNPSVLLEVALGDTNDPSLCFGRIYFGVGGFFGLVAEM